jgi:hypothetical protein
MSRTCHLSHFTSTVEVFNQLDDLGFWHSRLAQQVIADFRDDLCADDTLLAASNDFTRTFMFELFPSPDARPVAPTGGKG